jgi:tripartite-type tricarboxylate transporter receptor subunit TctC
VRLIAPRLGEAPGQQIIVENRPGASGAIATERVATAPADGYTLLAPTAADTVIPVLRAKLPYNPERDLAPVSLVSVAPFVLVVHPSVPARNVKELIALARAQPGRLSYGSVDVGTTPHLSAEAFIELFIIRDSDFGSRGFPYPRSLSRREREETSLLPSGEGPGRAQRGGRRREILS